MTSLPELGVKPSAISAEVASVPIPKGQSGIFAAPRRPEDQIAEMEASMNGQTLFLALVIAGFAAFIFGLAAASIWAGLGRD